MPRRRQLEPSWSAQWRHRDSVHISECVSAFTEGLNKDKDTRIWTFAFFFIVISRCKNYHDKLLAFTNTQLNNLLFALATVLIWRNVVIRPVSIDIWSPICYLEIQPRLNCQNCSFQHDFPQKSEKFDIRWRHAFRVSNGCCGDAWLPFKNERLKDSGAPRWTSQGLQISKRHPCWLQRQHFLKTPSTNVNLVNLFPCTYSHLFLSLPLKGNGLLTVCPKELTRSLRAGGIYLGGIKGRTVREHWDCWCVITDRALDVSEPGLASRAQSTHLNDIPVKRLGKNMHTTRLRQQVSFFKSCSPYVANNEPIRSVNKAINKWDFFMWWTASTKQVMMHSWWLNFTHNLAKLVKN